LDDLLLSLDVMWKRFETPCKVRDLRELKDECIALHRRFDEWQGSRVIELKSTVAGHVTRKQQDSAIAVGLWPGEVDTYFDLYVAGAWNVFRVARLLLIALTLKLLDTPEDDDSFARLIHTANSVAKELIASIPYHLAENLQIFLRQSAKSIEIFQPGRSLGGLLLMHPLYVASEMAFLPGNLREYMRRCLAWIGSNMGIGQADLLAKVRELVVSAQSTPVFNG